MNCDQQHRLFRRGLVLLRNGALSDAAVVFRRLVDEGSEEPIHVSYLGLLTAVVQGEPAQGMRLCERALQFGAYEPEVVLNASRVYESAGRRTKAIELLRRGLREKPRHAALVERIDRLSPRRRPPLGMIDRNHPLNRGLAIALSKLVRRDKDTIRRRRPPRSIPAAGA